MATLQCCFDSTQHHTSLPAVVKYWCHCARCCEAAL